MAEAARVSVSKGLDVLPQAEVASQTLTPPPQELETHEETTQGSSAN